MHGTHNIGFVWTIFWRCRCPKTRWKVCVVFLSVWSCCTKHWFCSAPKLKIAFDRIITLFGLYVCFFWTRAGPMLLKLRNGGISSRQISRRFSIKSFADELGHCFSGWLRGCCIYTVDRLLWQSEVKPNIIQIYNRLGDSGMSWNILWMILEFVTIFLVCRVERMIEQSKRMPRS